MAKKKQKIITPDDGKQYTWIQTSSENIFDKRMKRLKQEDTDKRHGWGRYGVVMDLYVTALRENLGMIKMGDIPARADKIDELAKWLDAPPSLVMSAVKKAIELGIIYVIGTEMWISNIWDRVGKFADRGKGRDNYMNFLRDRAKSVIGNCEPSFSRQYQYDLDRRHRHKDGTGTRLKPGTGTDDGTGTRLKPGTGPDGGTGTRRETAREAKSHQDEIIKDFIVSSTPSLVEEGGPNTEEAVKNLPSENLPSGGLSSGEISASACPLSGAGDNDTTERKPFDFSILDDYTGEPEEPKPSQSEISTSVEPIGNLKDVVAKRPIGNW